VSFSTVLRDLRQAGSVTIISHVRPDGDAYGSMLGLGLSLELAGKRIHLVNQDGMIPMYAFLPESHRVQRSTPQAPEADLLIAVDTSTFERLGPDCVSWNRPVDLNLDHHASNTLYGRTNLVDAEHPSTASLLWQLIREGGLPVDARVASALYTGVSTDTGSFRYRGTTAATFRAAAEMVDAGADPAELARHCYQSTSPQRFQLARLAMQSMQIEMDGALAHLAVTREMFEHSGAAPEDTEGLVEKLLEISTVRVGALFESMPDGKLRVSLRSKKDLDVGKVAGEFGGGGHRLAAGIRISGDPAAGRSRVIDRLKTLIQTGT
jgi:phosphoesterase RecJ-like protein